VESNRNARALAACGGNGKDKQEREHDKELSVYNGIDGFVGYRAIRRSFQFGIGTCFGVTAAAARIRKATWIQGDRGDFGKHSDEVVLGERAAECLGAELGDRVPVGHGMFHVIGILKTANGFEDGGVFMPLEAAQMRPFEVIVAIAAIIFAWGVVAPSGRFMAGYVSTSLSII
jgi:ABC-type lipoprotein release transport system permease subunit